MKEMVKTNYTILNDSWGWQIKQKIILFRENTGIKQLQRIETITKVDVFQIPDKTMINKWNTAKKKSLLKLTQAQRDSR